MADLVTSLVSALFEILFEATGRRLLGLLGWRRPHELACVFAGLAFWGAVGVLAYVILRR